MALEDGAAVFFVNSLSSMRGALENAGQWGVKGDGVGEGLPC